MSYERRIIVESLMRELQDIDLFVRWLDFIDPAIGSLCRYEMAAEAEKLQLTGDEDDETHSAIVERDRALRRQYLL